MRQKAGIVVVNAVALAIAPAIVLAIAGAGAVATGNEPAARRVEVKASRYAFEPSLIEVAQGETVELVLRSTDTEHGLAIKPLGIKVAIPKGGAPVSAHFVARKPGRFPIVCSEYCGSGHKRMRAELVVKEAVR